MLRRRSYLALIACAVVLRPIATFAQDKPFVTPKDLGKWESLGQSRLSPNGSWLAWSITRGNEENDLRLRGGPRDTTIVAPFGQSAAFSPDSRWFAYLIGVAPKERDRLTKEKKPVHNSFAVRNLASGEVIAIPEVSAFAFNPSGGFVSVTRYPAEGKKVSEVLVLDLVKGTRLSFSNVAEQSWSEVKPLLAIAVTTEGGAGNGVQLYDGASGTVRVLDSSPSIYRALSWRPKSDGLAVLRTIAQKEFTDTAHTIIAWESVTADENAPSVLDATKASGFPAGMRVADYRRPTWSRDGRTLYFGVQARVSKPDSSKKSDEKISDVEIWHTNDVRSIPEQRSSEQRDLRNTALAAWHTATGTVIQVGSDPNETATVLDGDRFATDVDRKPYPFGQKFGRRDEDVWTVDLTSGARKKLLEKARFDFAADPTGRRVPYFDGHDYWVADVATGAKTNLTAKLRARGVDFVDRDDDHPSDVLSPQTSPWWTKNGETMIVATEYDLWALALDGSGGKRLTDGSRDGVVYRVASFTGFNATPAERARSVTAAVPDALWEEDEAERLRAPHAERRRATLAARRCADRESHQGRQRRSLRIRAPAVRRIA